MSKVSTHAHDCDDEEEDDSTASSKAGSGTYSTMLQQSIDPFFHGESCTQSKNRVRVGSGTKVAIEFVHKS